MIRSLFEKGGCYASNNSTHQTKKSGIGRRLKFSLLTILTLPLCGLALPASADAGKIKFTGTVTYENKYTGARKKNFWKGGTICDFQTGPTCAVETQPQSLEVVRDPDSGQFTIGVYLGFFDRGKSVRYPEPLTLDQLKQGITLEYPGWTMEKAEIKRFSNFKSFSIYIQGTEVD